MADVVIKLGSLLVKTLSKPIAKGLKARLTNHPKMTEYCARVGQTSHLFWSIITIRAAGHVGLRVKPLDDASALNLGAETISEIFIFSVAGTCIILELARSDAVKARDAKAKRLKEEEKDAASARLLNDIELKLKQIELKQADLINRAEALALKREAGTVRSAHSPWFTWPMFFRK